MAKGDIDDSVIDTYEFAPTHGVYLDVIRVYNDVYAVTAKLSSDAVSLITTEIGPDGTFGDTNLDSASFESHSTTYKQSIARLPDTNWFVICYCGPNGDGWARSYSITNAGVIGGGTSTLEFDDGFGQYPQVYHIDGTVFAVIYVGDASNTAYCIVKTFTMATDGTIGAVLDTLEIYTADLCAEPVMVNVPGTSIYAAAFRNDDGNTGRIYTFTISKAGVIGATVIDNVTFETVAIIRPQIISVGGGVFAVIYRGWDVGLTDDQLEIKTFPIDNTGLIGSQIASRLYSTDADEPSVCHVVDDIYAIACKDYGETDAHSGWIITVQITSAGAISTPIDTLKYQSTLASYPVIFRRQGDAYIIAHHNPDNDGWLVSIGIASYDSYWPSESIMRVTGIRHIYRPGLFRMVLSLGDTSNTIEVAAHEARRELAIPEAQEPKPKPRIPPSWFEGFEPPEPERRRRRYPGLMGTGIMITEEREEDVERIRSLWRKITPWKEEAGETFGAEVVERYRAYTGFMKKWSIRSLFRRMRGG